MMLISLRALVVFSIVAIACWILISSVAPWCQRLQVTVPREKCLLRAVAAICLSSANNDPSEVSAVSIPPFSCRGTGIVARVLSDYAAVCGLHRARRAKASAAARTTRRLAPLQVIRHCIQHGPKTKPL
jgi:hypothetical protein